MTRRSSNNRPWSRSWCVLLGGLALIACGDDDATPTQVLLVVEADDVIREQASSVRISAYAGEGAFAPPRDTSALVEERDWPVAGESDWPIRVLLEPRRFADGRYRIVASTDVGAMGTVETQVISGYVAGELRVVRMRLHAACIDADPCAPTQRCNAVGACEDAEIPPDELECPDGGTCGPRDAGGPDVDAGGLDGGERDGGVVDVDAGTCDTDPDCGGGGARCIDGRCVPPDAGMPDGGVDAEPPPPPASPTLYDYTAAIAPDQGVEVLGAAPRDGVVVVGSIGNSASRDALAMRFGVDGTHLWSARLGAPSTDRLYSVATNGMETVAVGLSRISRGGPNNSDVLVVRVGDDGVDAPYTIGDASDQLLFGVVPGGETADFVGFGVCGSEGTRNALVLGFDIDEDSLSIRWARCYDLGGDEYFVSGVVVGRQIVAVGAQEPTVAAPGYLIVARVPSPGGESMPAVARRSRELGSRAYGVSLDPASGHALVAARMGSSGGRPTVLRLSALDISFRSAVTLPIAAVAPTVLIPDGPSVTVIGIRDVGGTYRPFVGRLGEQFSWVEYGNVRVSPFLPTPYVEVEGVARVIGEGSRAITVLPFTTTPAASCAGSVSTGSIGAAPSPTELETVSITTGTASFSADPLTTNTTLMLLPATREDCP